MRLLRRIGIGLCTVAVFAAPMVWQATGPSQAATITVPAQVAATNWSTMPDTTPASAQASDAPSRA